MFATTPRPRPQLPPPGRARSRPRSSQSFPELLRYPGTENLLALKLAESSRAERGGSNPRLNAAGSASHPPGTHLQKPALNPPGHICKKPGAFSRSKKKEKERGGKKKEKGK